MALSRCLECAEEDIAHEDMAYSLRNFHIDHIIATRLTIHFRDDFETIRSLISYPPTSIRSALVYGGYVDTMIGSQRLGTPLMQPLRPLTDIRSIRQPLNDGGNPMCGVTSSEPRLHP